ncbi:hypothetical protein ACIBI4_01850 [Streptomyces sp. NPDC050418]|uniref:hypothetical protein n=1 Tax=Streptomyces sp. NPDC050418 TaxID=3365612 RepID=UPI00378CD087
MGLPPVPPQPPSQPPGGGFGPPPGFGPPGEPPGGPRRRAGLLALLAAIVAVGAIAAVVLFVTGEDGDPGDGKSPTASATKKPTPSLSVPSELPTDIPTEVPSGLPSGLPTDIPTDFPSSFPSDFASPAPVGETPYFLLKAGDCFDVGKQAQGYAIKKSCTKAHDAEIVKIGELKGSYTSSTAIRNAATNLCQGPLDRKAARQPRGTVRGTLVQYPDTSGFKAGIDSVACSLSGDTKAGGRKLTGPLK